MKLHTFTCSVLVLSAICRALAAEPNTSEWGPLTNNAQMAISVIPPGSATARSFRVGETNIAPMPISVSALKKEVHAGEPFSLLVRIRNLSTNETLNFFNGGTYPDVKAGLALVVISPSGKDVSPRLAPTSTGMTVMSGSGYPLAAGPGHTIQFEFALSQLCKLEEIGTYKITARKGTEVLSKAQKAFVLTSNTLSVSVISGK